jgi:hypothetical protein
MTAMEKQLPYNSIASKVYFERFEPDSSHWEFFSNSSAQQTP